MQMFIASQWTGANELYPNDRLPVGMNPEDTCLELYRRFCQTPAAFALEESH